MRRPVLSLLLSLLLGFGNVVGAESVKVKVRRANVRVEPKVDSRVLATLTAGTSLEVIAREGEWYKVKVPEGIGYVFASLVEPEPAAPAKPAGPTAAAPEAAPSQPGLAIDHKAVACIVAERYPRMQACFAPADRLSRARVQFRAAGTPHWYYVDMTPEAGCFSATLPKPKKQTKQIDYYLEAVDAAFSESRTPEHAPIVVARQTDCQDRLTAAMLSTASVVVGSATGAPALPIGFSTSGLIAAGPAGAAAGASTGTAQGSSGSAGGAAVGTAGGLSLATVGLIAGGAVAAVGVAAAVAGGGGKDENPQDRDADRDGFTPAAGDCNDSDPSINPNGVVSFENARFEATSSTCPDGSNNGPISVAILVDGRNNRCGAVTITSLSVTLTVTAASNVNNQVGQMFTFDNQPFSPSSLAPGTRTTVRTDLTATCTNPPRNGAGFAELSAKLTISTSAGEFSAESVNRNRTDFPFHWP